MSEPQKFLKSFKSVVITGGSSGIGKCFIKTIRKANISIPICNISRSEPDLFSDDSAVTHFPCDISDEEQLTATLTEIVNFLRNLPSGPVLLINNAGFGSYGEFQNLDIPHELSMIDTNLRAIVQITGKLLPILLERGGHIVNVASTAAWQPTPYMATYGATKAFLLHWSLSLEAELKGSSVNVLALCPGPTESQFFIRAGFSKPPIAGFGESAEDVVNNTFKALIKRKSYVVSGWTNKLTVGIASKLPKSWQAPLTKLVLKKMRLDQMK